MKPMKHLKYLKYIIRHKWFVAMACFSRGLWWRALVHDLSKFRPDEWFPYAHSFYGPQPRTQETKNSFKTAWLLHQNRNSHHWQFWVLKNDDGTTEALRMPHDDVLEMVSDWDGAGRAINGKLDTVDWYLKNSGKMLLHQDTRFLVEDLLGIGDDVPF